MSQSAACSVGIDKSGGYWCASCGDLPKGPCEHWPMRELIERVRKESAREALERAAQAVKEFEMSDGWIEEKGDDIAAAIRDLLRQSRV